ncbi:MAG: 4-hydroxythreonine-4-phosphate dehydrogenase PdxA [Candidatus Omnitrophota bacterium]
MKASKQKIRIGITMGDPSGIGPAVIHKALKDIRGLADFTVIGDRGVFGQMSDVRPQMSDVRFVDLSNVKRKGFSFGKIKAEYGRASIEYLDTALALIRDKAIDCLVTSPISKEALNLAGFKYSGHTEYFIEKCKAHKTVMMLLNHKLKFSLVTRHIALKGVAQAINREKLYDNVLVTYKGLQSLFRIRRPRLVVCGLNPHASDNGVIGKEELEIILPAVKKIKNSLGAAIDGPLSADAAIYKAAQGRYDCVIAMYHDQALIPLKLTGIQTGVNLTLGLGFIRTSPLHGTAFDIAGYFSKACPQSLIEAVRLALRCRLNLKRD